MQKMNLVSAVGAALLAWGVWMPSQVSLPPVASSVLCEAASYRDASIRPIQLTVCTHKAVNADKEGVLLRTSMTRVILVGSDIHEIDEALGGALRKYNEEATLRWQSSHKKLLEQAKACRAERAASSASFFPCYENINDVFVRRADTLAVSLLESERSYESGVSGMYGVVGRNFDATTGRELTLDDVFTDRSELAGAIEAQLRRDYPSASFMENGGIGMMEIVDRMAKDGTLIWTLDPCGATFYFNPNLLGSYAEGIFAATILFDEQPGLFAGKYRRAPKSYCMELRPRLSVRTTFADGSGTSVNVTTTDGGARVIAGGVALDDRGEASELRPVLVSLADGRRYLYVDAIDAGDVWETTCVYDLSGNVPVRVPMNRRMTRRGDVDEDFTEAERGPIRIDEKRDKVFYIMTDPDNFFMSLLDEETGKAGLAECRVGADGAPEIIEVQSVD
ncbi:MAG: DUF3298 domain-containing protein [Schwartzia sp.]|nr:DUF3298 domain-containing protein [Schwartzia sp. (in: firmicutes)]